MSTLKLYREIAVKSVKGAVSGFGKLSTTDKVVAVATGTMSAVGTAMMFNRKTRKAGFVLVAASASGTLAFARWIEASVAETLSSITAEDSEENNDTDIVINEIDLSGAFAPAHDAIDRILKAHGESLESLGLEVDAALDRHAELDAEFEAELNRFEEITGEKPAMEKD